MLKLLHAKNWRTAGEGTLVLTLMFHCLCIIQYNRCGLNRKLNNAKDGRPLSLSLLFLTMILCMLKLQQTPKTLLFQVKQVSDQD